MAKRLTTSYLCMLTNADHYGVIRHIVDYLENDASTELAESEQYIASFNSLMTAHNTEVDAYLKIRKDYTSDELKAKYKEMMGYMSAVRYTIMGQTYLPEGQTNKTVADKLLLIIKSFKLDSKDGYETNSSKVDNIVDDLNKHEDLLTSLNIKTLVAQLGAACNTVRGLLKQRIQNEASRVKGLMKYTRAQTDDAIQRVFDIINAINTLTPTDALKANIDFLVSLETRAKQYYISHKSKSDTDGEDGSQEIGSDGSETGSGSQVSGSGTADGKENNSNPPSDVDFGDDE